MTVLIRNRQLLSVRESARKTSCLSNLKQLGMGMTMYASDSDDQAVPWNLYDHSPEVRGPWWDRSLHDPFGVALSWDRLIQPYLKSNAVLTCPSDAVSIRVVLPGHGPVTRSYCYPGSIGGGWCYWTPPRAMAAIPEPSLTITLVELDNCVQAAGQGYSSEWHRCAVSDSEGEIAWRHNRQSNVLYVDGHAKTAPWVNDPKKKGTNSNPSALYPFPGYTYDASGRGSLWGSHNPIPGGDDILGKQNCGAPTSNIRY